MTLALRINVDSTIEQIEVENITTTLQTQTAYPQEEYRLLERYEIYDNVWLYIYGMLDLSHPFNRYEFQQFSMTGDVFALLVNVDGEFMDLTEVDFVEFYEHEIDLDDTLIEDEMESTSDSYDYSTDWIEDDRLDSDGDVVMN